MARKEFLTTMYIGTEYEASKTLHKNFKVNH